MDEKLKPLFTPWRIGNCEIKNRIVLTSMGGTDLFGCPLGRLFYFHSVKF